MIPKTKTRNDLLFRCLLFVCIFSVNPIEAQKINKLFMKADACYAGQKYKQALHQYEKIIKLDAFNDTAFLQAARCCQMLEFYIKSDQYYKHLIVNSKEVDPIVFLEYGELLMKTGQFDEARSYLNSYNNLIEESDLRALRYISSIEDYDKYFTDSSFVQMKKLPCSTLGDDLNPVAYYGKLYFETNSEYQNSAPLLKDICYISNDQLDEHQGEKLKGSAFAKIRQQGFTIARTTGELIQTVVTDGQTTNSARLMRSFIEEEEARVSKPEQLTIESFNGNIAYPAVNSTGTILIFASDSPEGVGGWDLYISYRNSYGYSRPVLIEGFVNTLGDEKFPFIINDTLLVFSSNGHGGIGGYDLFYYNMKKPTSIPKNLGFPINSRFDDFSLSLSDDMQFGFLSSNRAEESTFADIYSFEVSKIRAFGEITDKNTGENLKNVSIEVMKKGEDKSEFTLADNGRFEIVSQPGDAFDLTVWREGYALDSFYTSTVNAPKIGINEVDLGKFAILKTSESIDRPRLEPKIEIEVGHPVKEELLIEEKITTEKPLEKVVTSGTVYRLQIAASRVPLSEEELKKKCRGNRNIFMFVEDNWYKYAIGEYGSFYQANKMRKQCGVKDAFISAYSGGYKMQLMSAIKEQNKIVAETSPVLKQIAGSRNVFRNVSVYFPFDLFEPDSKEMAKVDEAITLLKADPQLKVEIDGYSDYKGSLAYNFGLAAERAKYIGEYIITKGIRTERITIQSFGEQKFSEHRMGDCSSNNRQQNRRAEIILYK